ncbi:MAG: DUF1738 domain-containing protein [Bacteroidetes bacterium]|nr:DUF1738 domain-containing protein [Bacteroidota bacterium]
MSKKLYEQIAEKLIEKLKEGTSPFQQPWSNDNTFVLPYNPTTGKNYRGMNALWLAMQNYDDPRWMTLRQATARDWPVIKGEKATRIQFAKTTETVKMVDEKGQEIKDENGKAKTQTIKLDKPILATAFVFNAAQLRNIPALEVATKEKMAVQKWDPIERAEALVKDVNPTLKFGGNQAYYNPAKDLIQLPKKEQFGTATEYYATLLHEIGHWTSKEDRLNRPLGGKFGTPEYAKEELRAEIASLMLGNELQIGHYFEQHAAYVENWIEILENDPLELYKASNDAQAIHDFILDKEQRRDLVQDRGTPPTAARLQENDRISYNGTEYLVGGKLKGKNILVTDTANGNRMKVNPNDGLYKSLLQARNQQAAQARQQSKQSKPAEEPDNNMQHEHEDELEHEHLGMPELVLNGVQTEHQNRGIKI